MATAYIDISLEDVVEGFDYDACFDYPVYVRFTYAPNSNEKIRYKIVP